MTMREKFYVLVAAVITFGFTSHLHLTAGWLPTIIIGFGALSAGLVLWVMTSLRYPTNPKLLLPPYLLTAALLMLHIAEEYAFDFGDRIAAITNSGWTTDQFLWSLGLGFPIIWIAGAYAIAKRNPFGGFVSWFIFCGMLVGEPTHLIIFPVREIILHGGHYDYFPGMWTALVPLIPGIWGMWVIVKDYQLQRNQGYLFSEDREAQQLS